MILSGKNLGERHRDLNTKVQEALTNKVDFEQIKQNAEASDVDKLFKIDLANKYKNIDYIIEIWKSGNNFHITRTFKSTWIYNDKNIVNVDFLENEIFPHMAAKMKRKLLTNISMHVDEKRAESFFTYCMQKNLINNASKFLIKSSEGFKMQNLLKFEGNIRFLIGNSFELAEAFLKKHSFSHYNILNDISYMYSISDVKYLDLFEKYYKVDDRLKQELSIRVSKDFMKNHKQKLLTTPQLFVPALNTSILVKHITPDEAKCILKVLLPENVEKFWYPKGIIHSKFRALVNVIPTGEQFTFVKKIFDEKYPPHSFEGHTEFYSSKYYEILTEEEKEMWGTKYVKENKELYKLLQFEKAFEVMKDQILVTMDSHIEILMQVAKTATTQPQIHQFLNYFYDRHWNEHQKRVCIEDLIQTHNIMNFDKNNFIVFKKIIKYIPYRFRMNNTLDFITILLSILHEKDFTYGSCMSDLIHSGNTEHLDLIKNIPNEKKQMVFLELQKQIMKYIEEIHAFSIKFNTGHDEDYHHKMRRAVNYYLRMACHFDKTENDIPDTLMNYIQSRMSDFAYHKILSINFLTRGKLMRCLKKDASLACDFSSIKRSIIARRPPRPNAEEFRLNTVLRKFKVYFPDESERYVNFFKECLTEKSDENSDIKVIFTAILGIFHLADESYINDFFMRHVPTKPEINHEEIDETHFFIQEAICPNMCHAWPNIPIPKIVLFVQGDYVPFCLPTFDHLVQNLPPALCVQFIEKLINAPVKIQNHGLRLAFQSYSNQQLKTLVAKLWSENKDISLRMVLYTQMHERIIQRKEPTSQTELFELFRTMTLELNKDDHPHTLDVIGSLYVPRHLLGDFLDAAWKAVSTFPKNCGALKYKCIILRNITSENVTLMKREFLLPIMEDHIRDELMEKQDDDEDAAQLRLLKWFLVSKFIIMFSDEESRKININFVKIILQKCLEKWNKVKVKGSIPIYTMRQLCHKFIDQLVKDNTYCKRNSYSTANYIFEALLTDLRSVLPVEEMYLLIHWNLKLTLILNEVADFWIRQLEDSSESQKSTVLKSVSDVLATRMGLLISAMTRGGLYYVSFVDKIAEKLKEMIGNLQYILRVFAETDKCDMLITFAKSLCDFKMKEVYLLIVRIVPLECPEGYENEYRKLLEKIKSFNDSEVICCFYQKMTNDGYKRRKYY